jgi:SPX domain protein involved in polyphosphate accumulation
MDKVVPPILERYELKFVIPEYLIEPISEFVSIYCSLDKYSRESKDLFYGINNLYLDTPHFQFLRNRLVGCENRFNMRIRSYVSDPGFPYFVEVKQKKVNVILKYRARINEEDWIDIISKSNFVPRNVASDEELSNIQLFQRLGLSYNIGPKVLTQYRRKAYVSDHEEYARVTFDLALQYMTEDRYNLSPVEEKMIPYDHPLHFDEGCNVILEMKCYTSHVPLWMVDCIKTFGLRRRSFSKYATGVLEVINSFKLNPSDIQPVFVL